MTKYLFTGSLPVVATDLSYGPHVKITHTGDGNPVPAGPDGSTVVLHPGDVLEVDEPIVHADLHELADDLAEHLTTTLGVADTTAATAAPTETEKD